MATTEHSPPRNDTRRPPIVIAESEVTKQSHYPIAARFMKRSTTCNSVISNCRSSVDAKEFCHFVGSPEKRINETCKPKLSTERTSCDSPQEKITRLSKAVHGIHILIHELEPPLSSVTAVGYVVPHNTKLVDLLSMISGNDLKRVVLFNQYPLRFAHKIRNITEVEKRHPCKKAGTYCSRQVLRQIYPSVYCILGGVST